MGTEKIQYDVTVTGVAAAAGGFEKVGQSIDKSAKAQKSFETQVSGTNTAVGGLVTALSAADPRIAQFTFAISGARSALTGLVSALGGGVGLAAGAAAGAVIGALALFTRGQAEAAKAAEELTQSVAKQRAELDRLSDQLSNLAGISSNSTIAQARVAMNQPGVSNQERRRLQALIGIAEERQSQAEAEAQNRAALAQISAAEAGLGPEAKAKQRSGPTEFDRAQAVDRQIAALDKQLAAPGEKRAANQLADEQALAKQRVDAKVAAIKDGFAQERDARKAAMDEEQRDYEEHMRRVSATRQETQQSVINLGEFATQSFAKGLTQLVKGQKFAAAAILEGIGDQMVAEGTHLLFKAAAAAFIPGMQLSAGPLAGIGAAEIAAGLALGATAHAAAPGGGGGGGGLGTARPVTSVDQSKDDRPIIINLHNTIGPSAELGLVTDQSRVMATQQHGPYALTGG